MGDDDEWRVRKLLDTEGWKMEIESGFSLSRLQK